MGHWLITGGAGFIGTNLVLRLLEDGEQITVIDDLSRPGSELNASVLAEHGLNQLIRLSVADRHGLREVAETIAEPDFIIHLAGQVSLMQSLLDPIRDFEDNALGTLNILEVLRIKWPDARLIFSSTNKVYGDLSGYGISEKQNRFELPEFPHGLSEDTPLSFHGGYSCSKGAADQYVVDYSRHFGLDTYVLRQSAICGTWQNPKADQGWASFLVQETLNSRTVHLHGRGKQVRDLLDVEDLVALLIRISETKTPTHRVFNVGGGPERALSLLELFSELTTRGFSPSYEFGPSRPSDQMVFIADTSRAQECFDWQPQFDLASIIDRLIEAEQSRKFSSK